MTQTELIHLIRDTRNGVITCLNDHHSYRNEKEPLGPLLDFLRNNEIEPDWIPLTERVPDDTAVVLVTTDMFPDGCVTTALYEDGEFNVLGDVIAWMPFPSPYKGGHR